MEKIVITCPVAHSSVRFIITCYHEDGRVKSFLFSEEDRLDQLVAEFRSEYGESMAVEDYRHSA